MTHLFRIDLGPNSLFIRGFDVKKDLIEYEIRNPYGEIMVPRHMADVAVFPDRIAFDGIQLAMDLVREIFETLQADVDPEASLGAGTNNTAGQG